MFRTLGNIISTLNGVKFFQGYQQHSRRISLLHWRVLSTIGYIISTLEGVKYFGGNNINTCGGIPSVMLGDTPFHRHFYSNDMSKRFESRHKTNIQQLHYNYNNYNNKEKKKVFYHTV